MAVKVERSGSEDDNRGSEDGATKDGDNEHMGDQARTMGNGRQKEDMGPGRQGQAIGSSTLLVSVSLDWDLGRMTEETEEEKGDEDGNSEKEAEEEEDDS